MRQKNETATIFNQLKEITQIMQTQKRSAKTSANANASEPTQEQGNKPKAKARAKTHALKPTKRAFSERQITAFRDNSQASANKSDEALKQGLTTHQTNKKGGNNEAK